MKKTLCLRILIASLLVAGLATTFLFLGSSPLLAQSEGTGALSGTVTDATGAVVANAMVLATSVATNLSRTETTDAAGGYKFSLLPPGVYKLRFAAKGFKTVEVPAVTVATTQTTVRNQSLQVGAVSEVVQVTAGGEVLQTETSTLGGLIGSTTMTSLPLTSRNYTQVLAFSAGAVGAVNNAAAMGRGTQDMSANGVSAQGENFQLDGVNNNNWGREASSNDVSIFGGSAVPEPDAIQEFMVQTSSYDASYGRGAGANINVVTKSGTNQLHGTVFEFVRNAALNSKEYFSRSNLLNQNQFGGTGGGPIKKDKIFFFGSYQGTRATNGITSGSTYTAFLPGLTDDRSAAGVATAVDPLSGPAELRYCDEPLGISCDGTGIDPVALKILQTPGYNGMWGGKWFLPSGSGPTAFNSPATFTEDQVMGNLDYVISKKHTLAWREFFGRDPQINPMTWTGGSFGDPNTSIYRNYSEILRLTSILSNTFTNEARISAQRMVGEITDTPPPGDNPQAWGMTPTYPSETFPPTISFIVGPNMNAAVDPENSPFNTYQVADQMAWTHAQHTIRAGFEVEKVQNDMLDAGFQRGILLFVNLGMMLQGQVFMCPVCSEGPPEGVVNEFRANNLNWFVQDDWKFSKRLTLNLGLRWEYFGYPYSKYGNNTNIDPALIANVPTPTGPTTSGVGISMYVVPANYMNWPGRTAPPAGVTQASTNYSFGNPPKNGFAPRLGFSWQAAQKLVVRGAFGIFNNLPGEGDVFHGMSGAPPYAIGLGYGPGSGHTVDNPFVSSSGATLGQFPSFWSNLTCAPDGTDCSGTTSALNSANLSMVLKNPVTRQWNLDLQYAFTPNWMLEVGYVGSSGINQADTYHDENIPQLASPSNPINGQIANTVQNIPLRVPIVGFETAGLQTTEFNGKANYNSLQVTLKKNFSHGLLMQAAYTWSKNLTDLSGVGSESSEFAANTNNPSNLNDQYAPALWSRPQRLSVYYTYNFPVTNHPGALGQIVNNWILSGTTIAQDGTPLTMFDSGGGTIYGTGTSVAELCPGVTPHQMLAKVSKEQAAVSGYFNAAAFCNEPVPAFSTGGTDFGNEPIGAVAGPGNFNWDAALQKNFKLTERHSFEFRTEFYNFPNHTQFSNPVAAFGAPVSLSRGPSGAISPTDQGVLPSTSVNPRLIQFGLRYKF